jgi:hypothetical protein
MSKNIGNKVTDLPAFQEQVKLRETICSLQINI